MKKIVLFLTAILVSFAMFGQGITGQWNGVLKVPGGQLRVVFNVTKTENGYSSTMDSPDQGAKGIPITTTSFENSILKLEIPNAKIVYEGMLNKDNVIVGSFTQRGQSFTMDMSRGIIEKKVVVRPQEPQIPYPYYTEEVVFENKIDKNVLAGTLSLPQKEGRFPVVILITGSGPENRDEELFGHKPFLVLADYLTKKGIAVLRFDDRGVAKSTGDFKAATTMDFAKDVQAAVVYLQTRKEIDKNKIGLIGHSEGGVIAPIVAENSKDIDFIVLLAGTGIRGDKLMLLQKEKIERQMGTPENEIQKGQEIFKGAYDIVLASSAGDNNLKTKINSYFKLQFGDKMNEEQISALTDQITSPWMVNFLKFDPVSALEKVKCPVLAINGDKDLQVPADVNLDAINKAVVKGGNKKVTTKIVPNLNHLFQECKTGLPNEYGTIEQTFSPIALEEISKWVLLQVK
ncbi:alpha/beta hydrolase family protein [Flavobacterium laiguense]|uniref:Alpha/beta hydrolase n=1 Tax=Flavobacterium laiguense TaxID=2169409 RepID=A0A2U1JZX7_9FLAO|nr:alpha/beta fold hydrolase [Flavobacterium laiguense]PWA10810.1 alpha/beta hydrolase [Flavobacterium laiguense]